ncbi:MAG: flagellar hook-associated protein 3 [Frankiales bacterium]|nr:flagellar hook-associated protein 3 [Frankiales bacterium]
MRITNHAVQLTSLRGLNSNLAALNKLQQQLTSGKTISQPSDDPTGTNTSMNTRQDIAGATQQARNISDGQTFLNSTDSALQTMLDQVRNVRDLTVQALNSGAQDAQSQQAIATQVSGIRQSLLGQANQVVQGQPLFGGVTTGSQAYDPATGKYVGVGGANGIAVHPLTRQVSDVEAIRIDVTGPEAFGDPASGKDLFAVVNSVAADVADPTKLSTDLADLDKVINGLTTALADVGTRSARMDTAAANNATRQLTLQTKLSDTESIDLPKTIMNLQMQQVGYQAALSATAKALQPTLVDFLK